MAPVFPFECFAELEAEAVAVFGAVDDFAMAEGFVVPFTAA